MARNEAPTGSEIPFNAYDDAPVLAISQAATLAGMHPQTLRQYDRLGLVTPRRTMGRGRRYSQRDVAKLLEVQRLSQEEGINLAGIRRILTLEEQVSRLESRLDALSAQLEGGRVFAAGVSGDVVMVPRGRRVRRSAGERTVDAGRGGQVVETGEARALVLWRPGRGS
ncbi:MULTISPECIES: heat shock protein transcriptional repressor HspR [Oerskovia]|uniref:Helix-turn-helix transcriptional regulator n=2 Tax=Oerskovia TaxID=162491 RepID=A0ABR8UZQ0_9CELL|nr:MULTISPECIES: helix-turn-helix transcriptional regulator [Oerskovia]MBD7998022.1 helix-turn-helix transcriptional regulator [Oerskovia gallyi]MBM7498866.1 MerR family transcriptional regulator/heat shock protein HspR [Oerskovia paurometabola]